MMTSISKLSIPTETPHWTSTSLNVVPLLSSFAVWYLMVPYQKGSKAYFHLKKAQSLRSALQGMQWVVANVPDMFLCSGSGSSQCPHIVIFLQTANWALLHNHHCYFYRHWLYNLFYSTFSFHSTLHWHVRMRHSVRIHLILVLNKAVQSYQSLCWKTVKLVVLIIVCTKHFCIENSFIGVS